MVCSHWLNPISLIGQFGGLALVHLESYLVKTSPMQVETRPTVGLLLFIYLFIINIVHEVHSIENHIKLSEKIRQEHNDLYTIRNSLGLGRTNVVNDKLQFFLI